MNQEHQETRPRYEVPKQQLLGPLLLGILLLLVPAVYLPHLVAVGIYEELEDKRKPIPAWVERLATSGPLAKDVCYTRKQPR